MNVLAAAAEAKPAPRPPEVLMQPARLAALQPCRISASRALLVRAVRERWRITRRLFEIDDRARGQAFYRIEAGSWTFDFPVYSFEFSPVGRTGRIIGRSWDMMAALVEGPMRQADIDRTREELPKLYSGRATPGTLIWCRSNRSSRVFDHTLERLARGQQPEIAAVGQVCYLMRNTGLDGNGTFGTRSFATLERDHPFRTSLSAQMMCAYMMRVFAQDLIEHLARSRSSSAAPLKPDIARYLGVGNGSALGLVLFVNNHPRLIDRWLEARELALAEAKSLPVRPGDAQLQRLSDLIDRAIRFRREDRVRYEHLTPSARVAEDLEFIRSTVQAMNTGASEHSQAQYPLASLCDFLGSRIGAEAQETLHSLLIELVPDVADALADKLVVSEEMVTRPEMKVGRLRDILRAHYAWAFELDLTTPESRRYVWYKSINAEEPRRGPVDEVERAFNLGLDLPRLVQTTDSRLAAFPPDQSIARFLLANPDLRDFIARTQSLEGLRYHSPTMNMMGEAFVPIHIVGLMNRAIHGIDKTRDYLNRNLRGVLFHGAPLPEEIAAGNSGDWFWPSEPSQ